MDLRDKLDVLQKLSDIAKLAGIKARTNEEMLHLEAGFNLPDGRSQMVYVRPTAQNAKTGVVVTFFSPCLKVGKGFLKGLSKEQAVDLLKKNEQVLFARYGIWESDDSNLIVASVDQLLDTLDPDEFGTNMWHVAMAADQTVPGRSAVMVSWMWAKGVTMATSYLVMVVARTVHWKFAVMVL